MSQRTIDRIVGSLFLIAIGAYGGGSALVEAGLAGGGPGLITVGSLLMIANSVAVILIGLLLARAVSRTAPTIAAGYLVSRVAEAVLLAVGVTFTLLLAHPFAGPGSAARDVGLAVGDTAYQLAMISLALGSVPFFVLLVRLRAIHLVVAWWGAAGYALLLLGATLDLAGVPAGLALSLPGGLFEVAFAVILLVRGFGQLAATPVPAHAHGSSLPVA